MQQIINKNLNSNKKEKKPSHTTQYCCTHFVIRFNVIYYAPNYL